ncbi:MAG: TIGR04282 family arsenosugar biosynthesis glycosyltransferase [Paracoccaceae bacterium]|nr:TIGR04282 family arsenosugar biosynthesis glycosyltransferase [Paracoccaceae bacterium]
MVKEPRPGRVKTRLARDIGPVAAAWWFRHQLRRLLRRIDDPRWRTVLAVAPDHAGMQSRALPPRLPRLPQGPGDLGDRMARMIRSMPPGPVCVIGADIPGIDRAAISQAFRILGSHDAVFGPAPDGGYWLIGLNHRRAAPTTFLQNVRWSSPHALADSVASLGGARVGYAATLQDVDTAEDLKALNNRP